MALTKAQKKALADEGLGKDELAKLESILDADADKGGSNGSVKGKGRRVVVLDPQRRLPIDSEVLQARYPRGDYRQAG